jgi:hypothetical protein
MSRRDSPKIPGIFREISVVGNERVAHMGNPPQGTLHRRDYPVFDFSRRIEEKGGGYKARRSGLL